jgi:hypothetical protein
VMTSLAKEFRQTGHAASLLRRRGHGLGSF